MKSWTLIASSSAIDILGPLIDAHRLGGSVQIISLDQCSAVLENKWTNASSILYVRNREQLQGKGIDSIFLKTSEGQKIPLGWLPDDHDILSVYARTSSEIYHRYLKDLPSGPLVYLGSREERYKVLLDKMLKVSSNFTDEAEIKTYRWSAERIVRDDLLHALGMGIGIAIYVGHGLPTGWYAYAGIDQSHLSQWTTGNPVSAVVNIACDTARRVDKELSFAENLVFSGRCGTTLAATSKTLHDINKRFALRLVQVIAEINHKTAPLTLANCILHPLITELPLQHYRIIGDPSLPLVGSAKSHAQAKYIYAPSPNESLLKYNMTELFEPEDKYTSKDK